MDFKYSYSRFQVLKFILIEIKLYSPIFLFKKENFIRIEKMIFNYIIYFKRFAYENNVENLILNDFF
jgi:hypothetical protein